MKNTKKRDATTESESDSSQPGSTEPQATASETEKPLSEMSFAEVQNALALKRERKARFAKVEPNADGLFVSKEPPPDLSAPEAVQWARNRVEELAPLAAMILENDLRMETGSARRAVAQDVLDRAAVSKRNEALGSSSPLIVLQIGDSAALPKWAQRTAAPTAKERDDEEKP